MAIPTIVWNKYILKKHECEDLKKKLIEAEEELQQATKNVVIFMKENQPAIVDMNSYQYITR